MAGEDAPVLEFVTKAGLIVLAYRAGSGFDVLFNTPKLHCPFAGRFLPPARLDRHWHWGAWIGEQRFVGYAELVEEKLRAVGAIVDRTEGG